MDYYGSFRSFALIFITLCKNEILWICSTTTSAASIENNFVSGGGGRGEFLICLIHRFSTCGLPFHSRLVVNYSLERFPFIFNWQSLIFNKAHFFFFNFNFSKYLFVTHGERQVIWKRKELEISWSIEKKIDQFEEHRKEFLIKKKKKFHFFLAFKSWTIWKHAIELQS